MAWPKGKPRPKGAGRGKGTPNKVNAALKDMILGALAANGGQKYLEERARDEPRAFLALLGRVLPMQMTGPDGEALKAVIRVEFVGKDTEGI